MSAVEQFSECAPPRRGAVLAITVDSTARAYDMKSLALGGHTPTEAQRDPKRVVLWLQAETNDVYFYFASGAVAADQFSNETAVATTDVDDVDNTAAISAGSALSFANGYCALLKAGNGPLPVRINRGLDRFLVVKAASTSGTLRLWASSAAY